MLGILSVLAAITAPRMAAASDGAAETALQADLSVLRSAIELYAAEHGGVYPTAADIAEQMTGFTDRAGNVSATVGGAYVYGPYLARVPVLGLGKCSGRDDVKKAVKVPPEGEVGNAGWQYCGVTGRVWANAAGYLGY